MKSLQQIENARGILSEHIVQSPLLHDQKILLSGMLVALCWCADAPNGTTLQRIIDGEPMYFSENN